MRHLLQPQLHHPNAPYCADAPPNDQQPDVPTPSPASHLPAPRDRSLTISGELRQFYSERRHGLPQPDAADPNAPHVLIVENEENNRLLLEQILGYAGYRYLSTANGYEALAALDHTHIDLVLLDLSMPILDGIQTTQLIRSRPDSATLPIIAVTAHAMSDERDLALRSGCDDYLTKPFRPNDLLHMVERLLNRPTAE